MTPALVLWARLVDERIVVGFVSAWRVACSARAVRAFMRLWLYMWVLEQWCDGWRSTEYCLGGKSGRDMSRIGNQCWGIFGQLADCVTGGFRST
jgi:hypothetical protein